MCTWREGAGSTTAELPPGKAQTLLRVASLPGQCPLAAFPKRAGQSPIAPLCQVCAAALRAPLAAERSLSKAGAAAPFLLRPTAESGPGYDQQEQPRGRLSQEAAAHQQLEAELRGIRQKMRRYRQEQQELKLCQRRERILRTWLELSAGSEEQVDVPQVQGELDQLQGQIQSLARDLGEKRRQMQTYITRVQDIQATLKA
ncbi:hypothetical protein lerEdw1_019489 [Lerista edwardsae]|nr:hypothetical protein lerEdw1_019489 [Lerista edwardsae]